MDEPRSLRERHGTKRRLACMSGQPAWAAPWVVLAALRLETSDPGGLSVLVVTSEHVRTAAEHAVPVDGCVSFDVVREGMHCTYDHGWYWSSDDEPEDATLLEVRRGGVLLHSLTPRQLGQLPLDPDGYRRLRLLR